MLVTIVAGHDKMNGFIAVPTLIKTVKTFAARMRRIVE